MRLLFGFLLALASASPCRGAVFTITNTADTGAGSFRQAVADSTAAAGADEIAWGAGSGGTITLSTDTPGIAGSTVLDASSAPAAATIAGAVLIPLDGTVSFHNDNAGQAFTVSSVLSGTGGLVKSGTGQLVLSGVNTYTGGTRISDGTLAVAADSGLGGSGTLFLNGGALRTDAAFSTSRSIVMESRGGAIDTNGFDLTYSGLFSGSGVLIKRGAGTLVIQGSQAHSGGTLLNAGTVSINADDGLGSGAVTFNGGTLRTAANLTHSNSYLINAPGGTIDTNGFESIFSGAFTGTGALTKTGTGLIDFTGVNAFSGGTTIAAGTARIRRSDSLGTGAITIGGGTLAGGADIVLSNALTLTSSSSTIDTGAFDLTLSGVIGGAAAAALNKAGEGTLLLSGANTYAGATVVNAGTLEFGRNNAVPAASPVTVGGSGTLNLGDFTGTVASYAGAGTLKMRVRTGTTHLAVAGNANFTGGTLAVELGPQLVAEGDAFTPITYGSRTGAFAAITAPAALSFAPTYNAGSLTLTASFVPFANSAGNAAQASASAALENLRDNPAGDVGTVLAELYSLDADRLRTALDAVQPRGFSSMSGVGQAASGVQAAAVGRRMSVLARGGRSAGFSSYSVSGPSPFPGTLLAADKPYGAAADARRKGGWGFFGSMLGTSGRVHAAEGPSGTQPGYSFNAGGAAFGADRRIGDGLDAGASFGYVRGHASMFAPAAGTVDTSSFRFGVYATRHGERARANLYLGGALDLFRTRREIRFGGIERNATASPLGTEFDLRPSASFDLLRTRRYGTLSPFAALDYNRMMIGSFTEDGAGALSLNVDQQTAESLKSTIGLRLSGKYKGVEMPAVPYLSLGWRHEFIDQSRRVGASFVAGGGDFETLTGDYARDGTLLGAGIAWKISEAAAFNFDYAGDFRSQFQHNSANATFRYSF